jgi:hypothetical protein
MLICSCAHDRFLAFEYVPSLDNVREDHSIQVADMRGGVDVEDWRSNIVRLLRRWLG